MEVGLFNKIESFFSNGMSDFQMQNFVINDQLTGYRKLRQAVIEARSRLEILTTSNFELEDLKIDYDISVAEEQKLLCSTKDTNKIRKEELKKRKLAFEINRKETIIKQLENEAAFFLNQIPTIIKEDFRDVDEFLQNANSSGYLESGETEFWIKKLTMSAYTDMVNYGTITKGVLESIMCLSKEEQESIFQLAAQKNVEMNIKLNRNSENALVKLD